LHKGHPESQDLLRTALTQVNPPNIQHIVQTWPQVIFTCSQTLKEFLGDRRFRSDEVKAAVKECLNGLAAEVYDEGIQKLVAVYGNCLNVGGDYVEK
jgi:hypothetical protein